MVSLLLFEELKKSIESVPIVYFPLFLVFFLGYLSVLSVIGVSIKYLRRCKNGISERF